MTSVGEEEQALCRREGRTFRPQPGKHYRVVGDPEKRITVPEIAALGALRHRWVWEPRQVPHVPVFNKQKVPAGNISPDENARMLNVYMRPWVLGEDTQRPDRIVVPHVRLLAASHHMHEQARAVGRGDSQEETTHPEPPRKRLRHKAPPVVGAIVGTTPLLRRSHGESWDWYVHGHVVSHHSQRLITNFLSTCAARFLPREGEGE